MLIFRILLRLLDLGEAGLRIGTDLRWDERDDVKGMKICYMTVRYDGVFGFLPFFLYLLHSLEPVLYPQFIIIVDEILIHKTRYLFSMSRESEYGW